ncbi:MAG: hypothetical protein N3D09_05030 [Archaeoglobaceae archaeon]|nr:hypothetical protein [Archaeoglobaceae archaeon]
MGITDVRAFGLVGSILILFDLYLGYLGVERVGLLAILGLALLLMGVREVANQANYPKIFRDYLIYSIFTALFFITQLLTDIIILLWIFIFIGAIFLRGCFNNFALASGVMMFRRVALIYLISAVLFGLTIGLLLLPIAFTLQAVAFYSLPDTIQQIQETKEEYFERVEEEIPTIEPEKREL